MVEEEEGRGSSEESLKVSKTFYSAEKMGEASF
jgi:hypothetical protein